MINEPTILSVSKGALPKVADGAAVYVELDDHELVREKAGVLSHWLNRRRPHIYIDTKPHRIVVMDNVDIRGWRCVVKDTLILRATAENARSFLAFFYKPGIDQVTIQVFMSVLRPAVHEAVTANLSLLNLQRTLVGSPIWSTQRHQAIAKACDSIGLHLMHDELVIQQFIDD